MLSEVIQKFIYEKYPLQSIRAILAQDTDVSSDIDVYCLVDDHITSAVEIFDYKGIPIEIFVDNLTSAKAKIANADEIAVSFLTRLPIVYADDTGTLDALRNAIPEKFCLPPRRRNLVFYRIKVLYSKYLSAKQQQKLFFKGQILPQLMSLSFDAAGLWPASPKKWHEQLASTKHPLALKVLEAHTDDAVFAEVCEDAIDHLQPISLTKPNGQNSITLLS
jgi:hypothetical protein